MKLTMNSSDKSEQEISLGPVTVQQPLVSVSVSFPKFTRRVLILGVGPLARDLCQTLLSRRTGFTEVVGFLDKDSSRVGERLVNPSIIGTYDQLFEIAERYHVHTVAVCLEDRRAVLPVQTLLDMKAMGRDVVDGHYLYEEESGRLSIDHLKPSALIFSTGFRRRLVTMFLKRCLDVVIAIAGMIALLPLVFFLAVLIKMDSSGHVFYRQMRVGLRGRPYMIWKFRSMRQDAEQGGGAMGVKRRSTCVEGRSMDQKVEIGRTASADQCGKRGDELSRSKARAPCVCARIEKYHTVLRFKTYSSSRNYRLGTNAFSLWCIKGRLARQTSI